MPPPVVCRRTISISLFCVYSRVRSVLQGAKVGLWASKRRLTLLQCAARLHATIVVILAAVNMATRNVTAASNLSTRSSRFALATAPLPRVPLPPSGGEGGGWYHDPRRSSTTSMFLTMRFWHSIHVVHFPCFSCGLTGGRFHVSWV